MIHKAFAVLETLSADELTRRQAEVREKALKNEISMLNEALTKGVDLGEIIGKIQLLQQILHRPVSDKAQLLEIPLTELSALLRELKADAHVV